MRTIGILAAMAAAAPLTGCANRRAAVGIVTGAAAAATLAGCAASNARNNCAVDPQMCPRGYVLGIDSRCHRENAN